MKFSCRFSVVVLSVPSILTLVTAVTEGSDAGHVSHHRHHAQAVSQSKLHSQRARMWPFTSSNSSEDIEDTEDSDKPKVVKYGPDDCVATWRSSEGHCVVQTDCEEEDIGDYNFGLVCVDKSGRPVKHVFGEGAFDPSERFDSLISCNECLGLENVPEELRLNNDVVVVGGMVKELHVGMADLNKGLSRLNAAVFTPAPAANSSAPAPAAPESPAAAPAPAVQLVAHSRKSRSNGRRVVHHKRKATAHRKRGSAHQHRHRKKADVEDDGEEATVPVGEEDAQQGQRRGAEAPADVQSADEEEAQPPAVVQSADEEKAQPEVPEAAVRKTAEDAYKAMERREHVARLQRSRWQAHQGNVGGVAKPVSYSSDSQLRR